MVRVGVLSPVIGYLVFRKALRTLSALKHGTELRVRHAQHIHGEEIAMYPGIQNVWTHDVCRGAVMISVNIFKNIRIALGEEKKRDGHTPRIDIPGRFHETRVI